MKIRNSLDIPDWMLRRMTAWCCAEVGLPARKLKLAVFRNSRSLWGGCARWWKGQISVCISGPTNFPHSCNSHEEGESFSDRIECLVAVTAHEAYHIAAHVGGERTRGYGTRHNRSGSSERTTCLEEMRVLRLFRANREQLLAEWGEAPEVAARPVIPIQEKRAAKARTDLDRWTRKLRLAQTKVRKLKARAAYYGRLHAV